MSKSIKSWVFIASLLLLTMANGAFAKNSQTIKLAILDNANSFSEDPAYSDKLQNSYMRGIQTAIILAREDGFNIQMNPFLYGNSLLDVANKIPDVKAWHPDIVIGVNDTNHFLMARNYFSDVMVISLFASDYKLRTLPDNFHSMVVPDENIAEIFPKFVQDKFPNHNMFLAIAADSKESEDMSFLIKGVVKNKYPSISITESEFVQDEMETLNLDKLLHNYHKGDIIVLLAPNYYSGSKFMSRIAQYLKPYSPTFMVDFDNWGDGSVPTANLSAYHAYRISPYVLNPETPEYHRFYSAYVKIYNEAPKDQISFQTYSAVTSVVQALKMLPQNDKKNMRDKILLSYQKAIAKDPYWFRKKRLWVYEMTPGKETLQNYSYPFFDYDEK